MPRKWKIIIVIAMLVIGSIITLAFTQMNEPTGDEKYNGMPPDDGTNQSKITLASGEWAPYVSENLLHEGVVTRIVREAFEAEDLEIEFVYRPWNRSMEEARNGKWHGTLPWLKNEEREKDFFYSEPIAFQEYVIFCKKELNFTWGNISDLEGYTIGGIDCYSYGEEFDNAISEGQITVERTIEDAQNFQKLSAGRVDLVLCEINVGYDILETLSSEDSTNITHASKSVNAEPLYLLLSKKVEGNDDLIETFNQGLRLLSENDKMDLYWEESRNGDYKL